MKLLKRRGGVLFDVLRHGSFESRSKWFLSPVKGHVDNSVVNTGLLSIGPFLVFPFLLPSANGVRVPETPVSVSWAIKRVV